MNFSAFKENKPLVLLLDYDGTLAPIVPHPDLAVMEPKSEEALRSLAMHPDVFVAIISGRSVDSVREKVTRYLLLFNTILMFKFTVSGEY